MDENEELTGDCDMYMKPDHVEEGATTGKICLCWRDEFDLNRGRCRQRKITKSKNYIFWKGKPSSRGMTL